MSKQKIVTNDPKEHFTMMPNIIDESDLDPHEFRLLLHYYRVGNCWEGTRTTAKKCNMSVGTVSKKRQSLADKGWIILQKPDNSTDTITITLIDKWEENIAHFRDKTRSSGEPPVHQVNTPRSSGEHPRSSGERNNTNNKNNHIEKEYFVPNGTMSPPLPENPKPPKSKPKSKPKSDDTVVTEMLAAWGRLFPDKPQPRPTTYRSKIQTQLKMPQFREGWLEAMEWAANSPTCQNESWFHFGFFVQQTKGEYGWEKCLRHWMEWKDKKIRANGNGRTDCVNDVWQSIKIALGKPGKPDISDRALQAVGMVPGGWRRFKEQDVRFIDQLKPLFEEAYERTKQQQPATA